MKHNGDKILSWTDDTLFKRSESGEKEIRERALQLSKMEQLVLVSVDGVSTVDSLVQPFDDGARADFRLSLENLLAKNLVEAVARLDAGNSVNDDFFSSSMGGVESGSGLVVDTKNNSMRSVRRKQASDEVDLFIPLGEEEKTSRKKRVKKLVEVYPAPRVVKKRKKKLKKGPENRLLVGVYLALIGVGLVVILIAISRF